MGFKLLRGGGRGEDKAGTEQLDRFLGDAADRKLLSSLRDEEGRRRGILLAVAGLVVGLLAGGGGIWLGSWLWQTDSPESAASAPPERSEEGARLLIEQGWHFHLAREMAKAWASFGLATELAPDSVDAWDGRAMSLLLGGQVEDAERSFRRCLEIDPDYQRAYHGLGDLHFLTGDLERAEQYWKRAGAGRALGRLYLLQDRFDEATALLEPLLKERPDDTAVQRMVRMARARRLTSEERGQLRPEDPVSRSHDAALGWRLYYNGRFDEASTAFGRTLAGDPRDVSALNGLGWSSLRQGRITLARPYFERLLTIYPEHPGALDGLALCLRGEGQTQAAVKIWERLVRYDPLTPGLFQHGAFRELGALYAEQGDDHRALPYLARAVTRNPHDKEALQLLERTARRLQSSPPSPSVLREARPRLD
ncbi:MAG TPA: tetratricopeptide repeat protein [Thermoanaerobaculia bacterium]|nr:tetratricopeptide repeat protein [Thermoanaerobaculia bacterium]